MRFFINLKKRKLLKKIWAMKILFLCADGNSCRSLMAEALLQEIDQSLEVYSAGLYPDDEPDPLAIEVMWEIGIDISMKKPKSYIEFDGMFVDYLITLCDGTKDKISSFNIEAPHKIHIGFDDPKKAGVSANQVKDIYRDIRDEIRNELDYFYSHILENKS
jgi:arsenate reductase